MDSNLNGSGSLYQPTVLVFILPGKERKKDTTTCSYVSRREETSAVHAPNDLSQIPPSYQFFTFLFL